MSEKILIIVRGLPGAGKTSFAYKALGLSHVCTADDYHMINGKYEWKAERANYAHKKCQEKCEKLMKINARKITVANTSTTEKELEPYYELAKKYGYTVFSIIVENRHNGTTIHNVPEETIQKMKNRFNIKL